MISPPVTITSFKEVGTLFSLSVEVSAPKKYPKCVSALPSFFAPTKGMVMDVREEHFENAPSPIFVTLLGIYTEVRVFLLLNALAAMLVTALLLYVDGITRSLSVQEPTPVTA